MTDPSPSYHYAVIARALRESDAALLESFDIHSAEIRTVLRA